MRNTVKTGIKALIRCNPEGNVRTKATMTDLYDSTNWEQPCWNRSTSRSWKNHREFQWKAEKLIIGIQGWVANGWRTIRGSSYNEYEFRVWGFHPDWKIVHPDWKIDYDSDWFPELNPYEEVWDIQWESDNMYDYPHWYEDEDYHNQYDCLDDYYRNQAKVFKHHGWPEARDYHLRKEIEEALRHFEDEDESLSMLVIETLMASAVNTSWW